MSKIEIIDKKSETSVLDELSLLSKINHPFIINIHFAFQDNDYLYLVMDYLSGGDLRFHFNKNRGFNEVQTKFFLSNILLSLDYLHSNNILHRDVKPENLIFEKNGYLRLTDFGIAKKLEKNNKEETSGTPGYMSPEVLFGQNHNYAVDYFAIGVILYEIMFGHRPYLGTNRKNLKQEIFNKQIHIKKDDIPQGWSIDSADFANKLLVRKQNDRLGFNGSKEVFEHPWIKFFPWKELYLKKIKTPFKPKKTEDNFDSKFVNYVKIPGENTLERYNKYKITKNVNFIFRNYNFYFNEFDYFDPGNTKVIKFQNIHESLYDNLKEKNDSDEEININNNDEKECVIGKINKVNNIINIRKEYFNLNNKKMKKYCVSYKNFFLGNNNSNNLITSQEVNNHQFYKNKSLRSFCISSDTTNNSSTLSSNKNCMHFGGIK
jgi:serine/threonine protein kinase